MFHPKVSGLNSLFLTLINCFFHVSWEWLTFLAHVQLCEQKTYTFGMAKYQEGKLQCTVRYLNWIRVGKEVVLHTFQVWIGGQHHWNLCSGFCTASERAQDGFGDDVPGDAFVDTHVTLNVGLADARVGCIHQHAGRISQGVSNQLPE